jgi:signal transduction histidine kinase
VEKFEFEANRWANENRNRTLEPFIQSKWIQLVNRAIANIIGNAIKVCRARIFDNRD